MFQYHRILSRYLIITVLKATLVVMLIALAVNIFVELAGEAGATGKGSYDMAKALLYVPMIIPGDLYRFFPMVGLLGALIGLGSLSNTRELLIMRAAGMSVRQIMYAVFIAAIIMSIFMVLIGEFVAPRLFHQAELFKRTSISGSQAIETKHGVWMHVGHDFINIATVVDRDKLLGVTRYQFDDQQRLIAEAYAQQLNYIKQQWLATNTQETYLAEQVISSDHFAHRVWSLRLTPEALAFGVDDPSQMSMPQLIQFINYRLSVGLPVSQYSLAFWQRLFQPLGMLVMVLLAVPFVFGMARASSLGLRVLIGVVVGMGFYLFSQLIGQFSVVYQLPVWLGAFAPVGCFFLLGLWLLRRVR